MNDMKEKAMGAVKAFLERKGYEIVDEAWQGPEGIGGIDLVAVDEDGTLVFVDATARIGTDGFPEAHRARGLREALAATWLAGNGDDYADTPVRFDEVAMMVVKENRALLRHHVNCFGEMEPLSSAARPAPGSRGGTSPKSDPVPRKRTYTYVFVVHSACRTNPYGFVPTLRDSGRAGPDAARRAPR